MSMTASLQARSANIRLIDCRNSCLGHGRFAFDREENVRIRSDRTPGYLRDAAAKKLKIVQNIIRARDRIGLTQEEVSLRLGKSKNFMSKVEGLKRTVKAWELYDIADALETDARDLIGSPSRRELKAKE
jgi:hypothetical protein